MVHPMGGERQVVGPDACRLPPIRRVLPPPVAHRRHGSPSLHRTVVPARRFTHVTAARAHGLWLPPGVEDLPVFAAVERHDPRPQRAGLRVARRRDLGRIVDHDGLRLDSAPELLLACARDLGLVDLLVLMDSALYLERCTAQELHDLAARCDRRAGVPRFREALVLADGRSESPYETLLRLLHVVCGVPVEPQRVLRDPDGGFVARGDLWIIGTTTFHEYDGADHLERPRQRSDLARSRRIGNETWNRRGYTSAEVLHQAGLILRDADLSLGRPHRPERTRAWYRLLRESMFTAAGRAHVRRRLGLAAPQTAMGGT